MELQNKNEGDLNSVSDEIANQPTPPKSSPLWLNYVYGLIAVVVLAGVAYGSYYLSQGSSETVSDADEEQVVDIVDDVIDYQTPVGMIRYGNSTYGFAFDYALIGNERLIRLDRQEIGEEHKFVAMIGIPNTGSVRSRFYVYENHNLNEIVEDKIADLKISQSEFGEQFSLEYETVNGVDLTILKWHESYGDADHEMRIGKLKNGHVVAIEDTGWFKAPTPQKFLDSLREIKISFPLDVELIPITSN